MKTTFLIICATLFALTACSDRQQTAATPRKDAAPYTGTGVASFTQSGWKAGETPADKAAWEQHLKSRMQYSQNDYTRAN
ncbi:MAG TPA: hypothetical protein PKC80_00235 [Burkholderiaceae bacterium]|nr:hypothetical protein [Burkholderiaceae bacterium]